MVIKMIKKYICRILIIFGIKYLEIGININNKINSPIRPNILSNNIDMDETPILKPLFISKKLLIAAPPTVEGKT